MRCLLHCQTAVDKQVSALVTCRIATNMYVCTMQYEFFKK